MRAQSKALFFVNSFFGGGAERVCYDLIEEVCLRQDAKVIVLDGTDDYGDLPANCQVLDLGISPALPASRRMAAILRSRRRVDAFIGKPDEYDLITAHLNASHVVARLSRVRNKTLYVMHNAQRAATRANALAQRLWLKGIVGRRRCVVCVSEGIKEELVSNYSIEDTCCEVVYNPLNLRKISDLASRTECVHGSIGSYVLAVGRLHDVKRFDRLIKVFSQFGFEGMKLVILGEGPERQNLERLAYELGVEKAVDMPGFSANPYAWMAKSSAFVCCSDSEAFPVGLIEALVCGAKVVSADCDFGPREIMNGALSKYLVNPIDDLDQYTEKIKDAMTSYPAIPPTFFEKYSLDVTVDYYKGIWRGRYGSIGVDDDVS